MEALPNGSRVDRLEVFEGLALQASANFEEVADRLIVHVVRVLLPLAGDVGDDAGEGRRSAPGGIVGDVAANAHGVPGGGEPDVDRPSGAIAYGLGVGAESQIEVGAFEAVDFDSDEMLVQRATDRFDDGFVDFNFLALDVELTLFAQFAAQIANDPRELAVGRE